MTEIREKGGAPPIEGFRIGLRMREGWKQMWEQLSMDEFTQGVELAESIAPALELKPSSLITQLHRMAAAGVLEVEKRFVNIEVTRPFATKKGPVMHTMQTKRLRSYYRIK